mgnify:CR=1 FL=1
MNNRKLWTICLKWGLLFGAAAILFEVVRMVARHLEFSNPAAGSIALILLYVLLLHGGVKEFKEHFAGRLSFAKAFLCCILISLIGCLMLTAYEVVQYTYIEPDGLEQRYAQSLQNYRNTMEKDTVTTEEVKAYADSMSQMLTKQRDVLLNSQDTVVDFATQREVDKGLEMIQKYYVSGLTNDFQKRDMSRQDTLWTLPEFPMKARLNLMRTLELYLNQNPNAASTPYVQQVVQQSEQAMRSYSTADIRFEKKKDQIPHYTHPAGYAAVNSLFSLIYAILVGIFVALYHYRSKNAIDPVPEADEEATMADDGEQKM